MLIITAMSLAESAQSWLDKGAEAYSNMRLEEAGLDFEKAVEADPQSAKAHLSLGVIRLFQYQNGVGEAGNEGDLRGDPTREQWRVWTERKKAKIAGQNSTNAASAEEHLKRALALEPRNQTTTEYLASLYFWWRDPVTEGYARRDDSKRWYKRLLQMNPQHPFANYMCGVIDYETAMKIVRSNTGFPRPLTDESRRRSLRAHAGPLLAESARNFLRSLEIEPNTRGAMTYLMFIKRDQAYIADTEGEAVRDRAEADALKQKVYRIMEAEAKASGEPWPPNEAATITFDPVTQSSRAGKPPVPTFPPDARFWAVPPAPPPPPLPPAAGR